jgi:hypothetical protein
MGDTGWNKERLRQSHAIYYKKNLAKTAFTGIILRKAPIVNLIIIVLEK